MSSFALPFFPPCIFLHTCWFLFIWMKDTHTWRSYRLRISKELWLQVRLWVKNRAENGGFSRPSRWFKVTWRRHKCFPASVQSLAPDALLIALHCSATIWKGHLNVCTTIFALLVNWLQACAVNLHSFRLGQWRHIDLITGSVMDDNC